MEGSSNELDGEQGAHADIISNFRSFELQEPMRST